MSFHLFNVGPLTAILQKYADSQGFVPEPGDAWQDFQWSQSQKKAFAHRVKGSESWHNFLMNVSAKTLKAEQALTDLKYSDEWYLGKHTTE
ncbi:MAG: hypothetical protein Kow0049_25160 [Stanieria sp.]